MGTIPPEPWPKNPHFSICVWKFQSRTRQEFAKFSVSRIFCFEQKSCPSHAVTVAPRSGRPQLIPEPLVSPKPLSARVDLGTHSLHTEVFLQVLRDVSGTPSCTAAPFRWALPSSLCAPATVGSPSLHPGIGDSQRDLQGSRWVTHDMTKSVCPHPLAAPLVRDQGQLWGFGVAL